MRNSICKWMFVAMLFLANLIATAKDSTNRAFGFHVAIPDSFHKIATGVNEPDTLCKFADRDPSPEDPPNIIQIQRLRGVISPHQRLKPEEMPKVAGISTTLEETTWANFHLDVIRQVLSLPDQSKFLVYGVQFPLSGEAVQLQVGGPIAKDEEVRALFKSVVANFKNTKPLVGGFSAPSGRMLTKEERISRLVSGIVRMAITVVILSFIVIAILRSRRKNDPPKIQQR